MNLFYFTKRKEERKMGIKKFMSHEKQEQDNN